LNRYAYVKNNPLKYVDPTGNAIAPLTEKERDQAVSESSKSKTGLVIIDLQEGFAAFAAVRFDSTDTPYFDYDAVNEVRGNIFDLVEVAVEKKMPIFVIQTKPESSTPLDSVFYSPDKKLLESLEGVEYTSVEKIAESAFYETDFAEILAESGVDTLIFVGGFTGEDLCLYSTARQAKREGYNLMVPKPLTLAHPLEQQLEEEAIGWYEKNSEYILSADSLFSRYK